MKETYTQRPAINLNSLVTNRQAMKPRKGNSTSGMDSRGDCQRRMRLMAASGVDFDGMNYWFGPYRYERLDDALAYARLNRSDLYTRSQEEGGQRHWPEPEAPGAETRRLMEALGITFDGRSYRYDQYRYDQYADAINYAQLTRARGGTSPKE